MAAAQALESQPGSASGAMGLQRFESVMRTSGMKTTSAARPAKGMDQRRKEALVTLNEKAKATFHGAGFNGEAAGAGSLVVASCHTPNCRASQRHSRHNAS